MGIEYVLKSIAALIFIILAANVLLKKMNDLSTKGAKNIRIVEKMPLSRTSSLYIVEVLGKFYLMSGTDQRNDILEELDKAQVEKYVTKEEPQHPAMDWLTVWKEKRNQQ